MSNHNNSLFGNPNSSIADELKYYLELEGLKVSPIQLHQIKLQVERCYDSGGSVFQFLYVLTERLKLKKKNKNKTRDYKQERITRAAKEFGMTLEDAAAYIEKKDAEQARIKSQKQEAYQAKLNNRKVFIEKDDKVQEFDSLHNLCVWYGEMYGYKYSGAKTLINRYLKRKDLRDSNGYRFWRKRDEQEQG